MKLALPILCAAVIFGASMAATALLRNAAPELVAAHRWTEQAVLKSVLAGLSLLAIALFNRGGFIAAGFRKATDVRWRTVVLPALSMGAGSSLLILLAGSRGLASVVGNYGFPAIVFWIWFYSSLTEEIYTRGWFQSLVEERSPRHAIPASALLFGAMHLSLFRLIDPVAVVVIVLAATCLGWIAARLRKQYGSLVPPLVAHISFNVGGMFGGILYTIGFRIITGRLPVI